MISLPASFGFLISAASLAFGATPVARASDSGVPYAPYEEILARMMSLAVAHPDRARYVEYGRSVEGRPLALLRITDDDARVPGGTRPAIEISGAIHGNEYLGIELPLLERIIVERGSLPGIDELLGRGGVIYAIPVVNPDGYSRRVRRNARNVDLNRDFDEPPIGRSGFTQPETRELAGYLATDLVHESLGLAFTVDYHCCMAALDIPWGYRDALPEGDDLSAFVHLGELERSLIGLPWGNSSQTVGYAPAGTSKDYFYSRYGSLSVTFEGRREGELPYLEEHLRWIDGALRDTVLTRFFSRQGGP